MKKTSFKDLIIYVAILFILIGLVAVLINLNKADTPSYSDVIRYFEQEKVQSFILDDNSLIAKLRDGTTFEYEIADKYHFYLTVGDLIEEQRQKGIIEEYDMKPAWEAPWWLMLVPYLIIGLVFVLLWYTMFNRSGGGGDPMKFGKARTRNLAQNKKKYTFKDVAGADEEKEELQEIVDFLKNPKKFIDIGARIPKGVLLVGPPGTGKTLIAKAVAGEAGVQFLSISGSDFVELYVGVGASRVRDLFDQAKKTSPSIVFIDEIDAVGRRRGAGMGGGHDEREQTLNQLLVEMDGFASNEGVIIIAATNRPDILDPALLRPGRFDRQVYVGLPDIKGREEILKVHARGKLIDSSVNFATVAKSTSGFSGADLENLLNEAALRAARQNRPVITMEDIEESTIKVIAGPEKKSRVVSEKERKLTAYHEAGHAIVMRSLESHDPVHSISIIPRGMAGGMTISLPNEDKSYVSKTEMQERIASLLGGRVAEKLILNDISTGASNDLQRASDIARKMVTRYGMSDKIGPITFGSENDEVFLGRDFTQTRNYSENIASLIDEEVRNIIKSAYDRCVGILNDNMSHLHTVANYLLEHETMNAEEFEKVFAPSAE